MTDPSQWKDIQEKLSEPFAPDEVEWKAQATTKDKSRALAVAYINARAVMDRLDATVGAGSWSDSYRILSNGRNVECALTVHGVTKTDVGELPSEDGRSDPFKAAYSDALKRAAVKFGIGRYLYSLEAVWVPYDEKRKQLKQTPQLPAWAMPEGHQPQPRKQAPAPPKQNGSKQAPAPTDAMKRKFHAAGGDYYGDDWDTKRAELCKHVTNGRTESSNDLTAPEMAKLIDGIQSKLDARDKEVA